MRLGEMYEAEKNLPKAAEAYEKARQLNPNLLAANLKLAQFNAGFLQNKEKAIELAKKSRELAPNDPAVAGTLGAIVLRAGNYQWAYSLLQEAARGKSDDPGVLYELGMAAYALGKVDEARQTVQRALQLAPASSDRAADAKRFLNLTALEPSSPELIAAEPEINKILQTEPDFVPALMGRGALQLKHNDPGWGNPDVHRRLASLSGFCPCPKTSGGDLREPASRSRKGRRTGCERQKGAPE